MAVTTTQQRSPPLRLPVKKHTRHRWIGDTISTGAGSEAVVLSDDEVADLERQLDEIDQLLAGVDADLSQD